MSNDPWAAAQNAAASAAPAANGDGQSQLAGSYAGQPSGIFSSGQGAGPSLFNKTHPVGTSRSGTIAKKPYDRQSTNTKGEPKYWQQGSNKPVLNAVSPSGQQNRPCMDTIVELDTDYTMDQAEAAALNREAPYEGGRRSVTLAGDRMKASIAALGAYNSAHPSAPIRSDADLVGKRLTEKRVGQKPNPNGGDPIKIHEYEIADA